MDKEYSPFTLDSGRAAVHEPTTVSIMVYVEQRLTFYEVRDRLG